MGERLHRFGEGLEQLALQRGPARDAAGVRSAALAMAKDRKKGFRRPTSTFQFAARGARAGGPVPVAAQVLSVVDHQATPVSCPSPSSEGGLELRVGVWHISLKRVTD